MDELQKLYDVLVREGKYTKSFEEFQSKWSQDQAYKDKVYDVVSRDGLYTKDKNSFFQKYSVGGGLIPKPEDQPIAQPEQEPVDFKKNGSQDIFGFSQPAPKAPSVLTPQAQQEYIAEQKVKPAPIPAPETTQPSIAPTETVAMGPMGMYGLQRTKDFKPAEEFKNKSVAYITGDLLKTVGKGVVKFPADALETIAIGASAIDNLIAKTGLTEKTEASKLATYQAAQEYRKLIDEVIPTDKDIESGFWGQSANALGQMVPIILSGFTAGGAKAIATQAAKKGTKLESIINYGKTLASRMATPQGGLTISQVAAPSYEQAKSEGATENEALTYAIQNALVSYPIEMLPVDGLFKRLDKALVGNRGVEILKKAVIGGSEEAITEGIQNIYENVSANQIYGTTKDFLEGTGNASAVGGTVGLITNGLLTALLGRRARATTNEEKAELDKSIEETKKKVEQINSNNQNFTETINTLEQFKPISLAYGSAEYNFIESPEGNLELAQDDITKEQAEGIIKNLSNTYKKIEFSVQEIEPEDPYQPTTYKVVGTPIKTEPTAETPEIAQQRVDRIAEIQSIIANDDATFAETGQRPLLKDARTELQTELETLKSEQDAIQVETAGQVPVLTEAGVGEEVVQGKPKAEPQVVAQEGVQEEVTDEETQKIATQLNDLVNNFTTAYSQPTDTQTTSEKRTATKNANKAIKKLNDFFGFAFGGRANEDQAKKQDALSNIKSLLNQDSPLVQFANITELMDAYKNDKQNNVESPLVKSVDTIFDIAPTVSLETQVAPEVVVEEEQYVPLTVSDIGFDKIFSKENASDVVDGERERDNGTTYNYIAEVETPVSDVDGNEIGYLVKMVDEDKNLTFEARDEDGNNLSKNEEGFDTLGEARQALLDNHNKQKKKEFIKESKAKAKEKAKADLKEAAKKAKAEAKKPIPTTPVKAEPITETEEEQVARMMELFEKGAKATTDSGISVTNKSQIDNIKGKISDKLKIKVIESAQKALKTLRSVLPNFDIVIHDNEGSYNAAMIARGGVAGSSGNFSINNKGSYSGRIDINLDKANARTVAHEVAHGIMLKTFGDSPALFKNFRDRISTVLKESANQKLIDFSAQYEGDVTYEEYLAELTAILEQKEENISPSTFQKIAAIINSVISKITNGTFKPFEDVKNTKETIEFFSAIAKSIRQGEEISTIDLKAIDEKKGKEKVRGDLSIAQKTKIVAAETGVIRELESQAANRVKDLGGLLGFDLGKPVSKSQISNTSLPVNTEVANGYDVLKKKFGETAARAIRENIPFALDYPNEFAEFISKKIPVKEDIAFVVKNLSQRLDGLFRLEADKNIETVQVKNKTPEELSKEAGYVFHRPESENDILAFKKDFENGEVLCTYNDVEGRMQGHFIFWLRRNDAESVLPAKKITQEYLKDDSEGSSLWRGYLDAKGLKMPDGSYDISNLTASRQDPYGTSSMSVQIGRRGGNISIKNRYNHTVNNPDATFGNDLNTIIDGLNDAVFGIEGIPKKTNQELRLPDNITSDSQGRFFKYDQEIENIYVSQHGYVEDGEMTIIDKSYQRMIDNFVFDSKNNEVYPITIGRQLIGNINKISFEKNKITVDSKDGKFEFELLDGFLNKLNSNTTTIGNSFLRYNITLNSISLPNVEEIGDGFLYQNLNLKSISFPNVKKIDDYFIASNRDLESISLPNVEKIGSDFLRFNENLENISLPNVEIIGDAFLRNNADLNSISLPKVKEIGSNFLNQNNSLKSILLPNVEEIDDYFLKSNRFLESISLPNVKIIGDDFLQNNSKLENILLPNVEIIGSSFLDNNIGLENISLPKIINIGSYFISRNIILSDIKLPNATNIKAHFLRNNADLKSISLPNVKEIGDGFMNRNKNLESISLPNVEFIGLAFLNDNEKLKSISLPNIKRIGDYFMINNESVERPPISKSQISSNNEINAAVKNFREQGFSESAIKAFLIKQGYSATEANQIMNIGPIQEEFNSLMNEVDKLIARQKSIGIEDSRITSNIDTFIRKRDEYLNANDAQKKIIEREARAKMGAAPKRAVSIGRVLGALKDITNISREEKLKVISQIRQLSKDAAKDLAKEIRAMASSGKITAVQAANIISRFGRVNMLNEISVSNFVDYMAKVFANAEYANKIDVAKSKLKNARQNIATKIGIADGLVGPLQRLFSVNPDIIPAKYLERYLELLNMFSERKAVLTLEEKSKVIKDVESILSEIDIEQSKVDELADRFNNSESKVFNDEGGLDFDASIKEMVKQDEITQEEADIMRKYKSDIMPQVESQKMTDEEVLEKKKEYIAELKDVGINPTGLSSQDERNLAKRLSNLIGSTRVEELMNLSLTDLKNLLKVADNINNNYLPHYAQLMVEKLTAINNAKTLTSAVKRAVIAPFSGLYSRVKSFVLKSKRTAISEMIRRNPLFYVDQLFGDFKTKDIFNSLLSKVSEGESKFKTELKRVQNILEKAEERVAKSFNLNPDKTLMSKFKMMTYMIQLEYDSNQGSKQVNPAAEYLKTTIKHIDEGKSQFGERDANMLQSILKEFAPDGNIDNEKLYKSFNEAEKSAIKDIRGVNESLREKAEYTASIIRGDRINPLTNYVHLNVLHEHQPNDLTSGVAFVNDYNNAMRPSTKAKSLIERTGKVSPLNFDVFASAQRGAKFVLMDYNLTEPIRTARKTIKQTITNFEKEGRIPKEKRQIINAIDSAFEEATENLLTNTFVSNSFGDDVADYIQKQGYRAVLAGTGRFVSELTSNIGFAVIIDPKAFSTGIDNKGFIMSVDAPLVMENVGSKQTNRVFPTDTLSGKLIDTNILQQASGIRGAKSKNPVANKIQQIWNLSGKKYVNAVELMADTLISTPDKLIMRPMWFGSFANEFKNITGKKVDFDKIAANDESYMGQYKVAIEKAKTTADEKTVMTGATDNAFMGILKGTVKPDQSVTTRAFNNFNNFMTRFLIFEYVTARTGINAAMGNGSLTKKQGVALLGAVTTRMVVYTLLTQMVGTGLMGLFFDDDEEETEKTFMQKLGQSLASAMTSLILGRDFGNATKMIINEGVERANEKYLDFLREGEYDPYKDAIQYSIFPNEKKGRQTDLFDFFLNMGGAFGPALKTLDFIFRKALEPEKKKEEAIERREKEINVRIPLEILGNAGLIPLYKDIRKAVMKDIYKDLEKAEKTLGDKKKIKAEKLQGYETESDMKRYDPDLWDRTFGEDAVDYDEREAEKALKKAKDSLERAMKDEMYNYTPKSKGGFGSAGFGEKSKSKGGFGSAKFGGN